MAEELSEFWAENRIAEAYSLVIEKTDFYQEMTGQVLAQLTGCAKILDMGCGTGYLVRQAAQAGMSALGIDVSGAMIASAQSSAQNEGVSSKASFLRADALSFASDDLFDAVVICNLLPPSEKPYELLDNAYRLLAPGGKIVVVTARHNPCMDVVFDALRNSHRADARALDYISMLEGFNKGALRRKMNTFDPAEFEDVLLKYVGFEKITHRSSTYLGQNFIVVARKPLREENIIYEQVSTQEMAEEVFMLRYHLLHDRIGYLEDIGSRRERTRFDCDSVSFVALTENSRKPVGCFTLVFDSDAGLPEEGTLALTPDIREKESVASPYRWMVLPKYRNSGVGKMLFKKLYDLSVSRGITLWAFPINPALKDFFLGKMGCVQVGPEQPYHNKTGIPLHAKLSSINVSAFS